MRRVTLLKTQQPATPPTPSPPAHTHLTNAAWRGTMRRVTLTPAIAGTMPRRSDTSSSTLRGEEIQEG